MHGVNEGSRFGAQRGGRSSTTISVGCLGGIKQMFRYEFDLYLLTLVAYSPPLIASLKVKLECG